MQLLVLFAAVTACAASVEMLVDTSFESKDLTCCPTDIYDDEQSTGRVIFVPSLKKCSKTTTLLCSNPNDFVVALKVAVNKPANVVASTTDGGNVVLGLTCSAGGQWTTSEGVTVEKIYCLA